MVKVVAGLIKKDGKYLIARRNHGDIEANGKWEFPGGKLEEKETELEAIEREMREEFEVNVKALMFLASSVSEYIERTIELRLYLCDYINSEFKLHDHHEIKWIELSELLNYDFAPADKVLVNNIINMDI